jgi:hypothetical protein
MKEGESPILPGEEREEALESLGRSFLYHLEFGGGLGVTSP